MHPNEKLLHSFYGHLDRLNAPGMCQCYQREVVFSDPIFRSLKSWEAAAMWHMLCDRSDGIDVDVIDIHADDERGEARWEARYVYSDTGRIVHNIVRSKFKFFQGKVIRQKDDFDLWRWSRMALGAKGALLGWSPAFQRKLRRMARRRRKRYIRQKTAGV